VIETGIETRYQPTVALLEQLDPRPDGLIVASPCNPAGTMLHRDELAAIASWCDRNGVRLISDEIYHGLQYGQPVATAAQFSPSAVVVNSFSKYFSMTGWRVGWTVLPEDLVRPVECLAQNLYADVGARTNDSAAFCARMLAEAGVAAAAGVDFDAGRGHRTVRFSYCGPEADMAEAVERLRAFQ
jgi:aspartate/methionine/tyrosine aminotransferase